MQARVTDEKQSAPPPAPRPDDENEPPPPLPVYMGGYALVFLGIVGFALVLVLVAKLLR